jgi:WD40 repeat protein
MDLEAGHPRIFVSYARSDGTALARELRRRLSEHGFSLWQDVADMEGGKDWWHQITEAIRRVEYLVLVMTPAALSSAVVCKEWRLARQHGVCVLPIKGAPDTEFSQLAGWMRRAHFVDPGVPEQWARLVRTLEGPCQATRVPLMAEPPPDDFVPRPQEFDALRAQLLDVEHGEPVAITAALRGAGGYGKTTLARALCHDDAVQDVFFDGVLWVTLGEQPGELSAKVEDLIVALSGQPSQLSSLEARKSRLAELLRDRSLLLVVDDVWSGAHLDPFLVGGPRCARLVTTRNSDTLPRNTREVAVDAMRPSEAVSMLRLELPSGEDAALAALAARLGEWPLLLALVNRALRDRVARAHDTFAGALAHVNRVLDRRGLTGFDARDASQRSTAVARTVAVSVELLDENERRRFRELAVFPEDVDVPLATIETLWHATAGLDDLTTEELLQRLYRLSLLLSFDLENRRVRLHDVIRAYLRQENPAGLADLDRTLVDAYQARCSDGWSTVPDDGYVFRYLGRHLASSGRANDLRELLLDIDWIGTKLRRTDIAALLEDYGLFANDRATRVLGQALRLSAHVVADEPRALVSQLFGRIDGAAEPELGIQLRTYVQDSPGPWLLPLTASLARPGGPLLQTLAGHWGPVSTVGVTPDGRRVVSGSDDGTLKVWDLESGEALRTFGGHARGVSAVAVAPNGRRIVSASYDRTLKVWDLAGNEELSTLAGHAGHVRAVAMTPDGERIVSGSKDRTLRTWDLASGRVLASFVGHESGVNCVAVTPDGGRVVSGSDDATIRVWDLESGQAQATLVGHLGSVRAVAVTPDGGRVVSGSWDRTLRVWDLARGEELAIIGGHQAEIHAVAVTPDGRRAVSGSEDGTLTVWEIADGRTLATFAGHAKWVGTVAVATDGGRVVSGSGDHTLKVWDLSLIHI